MSLIKVGSSVVKTDAFSNKYEVVTSASTSVFNTGFDISSTTVVVYVDGVRQQADAYSVSGARQITLSDTVVSGTAVAITAMDTSPVTNLAAKADKVSGTPTDKIAKLTSTGNLADAGFLAADVVVKSGTPVSGDMLTFNGTNWVSLLKGAANLKMFMNAAGTTQEWASGMALLTGVRDPDTVGGTQVFSGLGFKPSMVLGFVGSNTAKGYWSVGAYDGGTSACIAGVGGGLTFGGAQFLSACEVWGVTGNSAVGTSLDTGGFTVTWTRTGSPTGNADEIRMFFICFR
jgi:hypothetical protein